MTARYLRLSTNKGAFGVQNAAVDIGCMVFAYYRVFRFKSRKLSYD